MAWLSRTADRKKSLGGVNNKIPPSQVFDFSFVNRAAR